MKTTNLKPAAIALQLLFFCFTLFQTVNAQKGDLVLNFSGKDAVTSNIVPLENVKVSNETQGGDTTLYGTAPTLSLHYASGIFEQNYGQQASFVLDPNYPNPFAENTKVNLLLRKPQQLIITLYDQQGAVAANLEQDFGFGTHRFEISVPQNRLCLLTANDGITTKTLKLFSTSGKDYRIKYLGTDENAGYKSGTETAAFVFQPGDVLKFSVNAAGYYEYITYDNPVASMNYVFSLQPNTTELPPTVTTAAVTNITATTAACGGDVTSEGSAAVTARGVCWNTAPGATIANSFTADGAGTGAFNSTITGLTENTTYYVRAYATNQFGTAYGNEVSFITEAFEPFYSCDSAITYSNQNGIEKTIYTRNTSGQILKVVNKDLNTSYGIWVNDYQSLYTYDVQGNLISVLGQVWNSNIGNWVNDYQNLYIYGVQGNQLSSVYQVWITEIGNWANNSQNLFTYDALGNLLSNLGQVWKTEFGNWTNSYQHLNTYDNQGNRLSYSFQNWNMEIGNWVYDMQMFWTYNAQGNILSNTYQIWSMENGNWLNIWRSFINYDNLGISISSLSQEWNSEIGNWVNNWQDFYTYDNLGIHISTLGQDWITEIGSWVNSSQVFFTYDTQANMLSEVFQIWNTEIGSWFNNRQYLYTYDAQGNKLIELYQIWNGSYGTWVNVNKYEYQYDYPNRKITAMYYEWSGAWVPVDYWLQVYLFNNFLHNLSDGYKIEVWYNSYQVLAPDNFRHLPEESFYQNHSNHEKNNISTGNPARKDASARINPKTKILEKEAWMDNGLSKPPVNNRLQRNKPVQTVTLENFHSN